MCVCFGVRGVGFFRYVCCLVLLLLFFCVPKDFYLRFVDRMSEIKVCGLVLLLLLLLLFFFFLFFVRPVTTLGDQ